MNGYFSRFRLLFIITIILILLVVFILLAIILSGGKVLQATDNVMVTAQVQNCILQFRVYPEKRIPSIGNWANINQVQVNQVGSNVQVLNNSGVVTDNNGNATINLCNQNAILLDQDYDFYITGESHLRRLFSSIPFSNATGFVNLTTTGKLLLAGDTSIIKDNKVNSLDISTQINKLYTSDSRNDLNKDGVVNSLDLSNVIYNLYLIGD